MQLHRLSAGIAAFAAALAVSGSALAVESPPSGILPSEFATKYSGCLGKLRSKIAQGDFAGIGPFGEHFTGLVNPGAHQGTVGEEEFLEIVIGIQADELAAFHGEATPPGQAYLESHPENGRELYELAQNQSAVYGNPRLVRFGARLAF